VALEVMANSDNVLRAGLTPKYIDIPELVANVKFEAKPAGELLTQPAARRGAGLPDPGGRFCLLAARPLRRGQRSGPASAAIIFCVDGEAVLRKGDQSLTLSRASRLSWPPMNRRCRSAAAAWRACSISSSKLLTFQVALTDHDNSARRSLRLASFMDKCYEKIAGRSRNHRGAGRGTDRRRLVHRKQLEGRIADMVQQAAHSSSRAGTGLELSYQDYQRGLFSSHLQLVVKPIAGQANGWLAAGQSVVLTRWSITAPSRWPR
jgi:hypothetical protein